MKIILGLGNPGVEYTNTRHNVGVMFLDKLTMDNGQLTSSEYGWRKNYDALIYKTDEFVLVKTKSIFMNESGRLLQGVMDNGQWTMDNLYIVHDDLDIKLGEYKIQMGKGPKVHNGVNSIETTLGTKEFWRIRIGIENRTTPVSGEEYVLQQFTKEEMAILDVVFEKIIGEL